MCQLDGALKMLVKTLFICAQLGCVRTMVAVGLPLHDGE